MCHLPETGPEDRNVASSIHQSKQTWCHGPPQWESACFLPRRPHCRSVPEQGGLCPAVRAPGLGKVQLPASSVTKLQQPSESLQVTSQPLLGLSPQEDEPASCRPAPLGVLRTAEAAGLAGHPSPSSTFIPSLLLHTVLLPSSPVLAAHSSIPPTQVPAQ